MARPLRIQFPEAIYHVTSRGHERSPIVSDAADRDRWQATLARTVDRFRWRLFAYALLDNHFHLFVQTPEANLAEGMHHLNVAYAGYYNARHQRVGHLFQGRYKGVLVEDEGYWLELSRYVHLNPVRAGAVDRPEAWSWSSYVGYHRPAKRVAWVDYARVLADFGGDTSASRRRYRVFIEAGLGRRLGSPLSAAVHGLVLGSDRFVARIRAMLADRLPDAEVPALARLRPRPTVEAVLSAVARRFRADRSRWSSGRRCDDVFRAVAALTARSLTGVPDGPIAAALGYRSPSSVPRACQRAQLAMKNPRLGRDVAAIQADFAANH